MDALRLIRGSRRELAAAHGDGADAVLGEVWQSCELVEAVGAGIANALDGLEFLGAEPRADGAGADGAGAAAPVGARVPMGPPRPEAGEGRPTGFAAASDSPSAEPRSAAPPPSDPTSDDAAVAGAWSAGAAAEAARSVAEAAAHVARAVGRPPEAEPYPSPAGDQTPDPASGPPADGWSAPGRVSRLTGVADPPAAVHEMRRLVHEAAEALIALACAATEEDLYWRCIDAVDAAAECKALVTDLLRALGEAVPPERPPDTGLTLPRPGADREPERQP
jgi:hypothetical protein